MTLALEQAPPIIEDAAVQAALLLEAQGIINEATARIEAEQVAGLRAIGIIDDIPGGVDMAAVDSSLVDVNIQAKETVISPRLLNEALPAREGSPQAITSKLGRAAIENIMVGNDDRIVVITGPCSIHNAEEALEYAEKVQLWREEFGKNLEIVMRTYFEKPRTEDGWKGLIYDPRLDGSHDINLGLTLSRIVAHRITGMGVPIAMERLNPLTPQYMNGLVSYDAVGARSVEHQPAREYISGSSSVAGFKNSTDGGIDGAISAIVAAGSKHSFLGLDESGMVAAVSTTGNDRAHIILRGGKNGPNYGPEHVARVKEALAAKSAKLGVDLPQAIVIDASHGNSGKRAERQHLVIESIADQITSGEEAIRGVMIESYLRHGKQDLGDGTGLEEGKSITDECIDIDETYLALQLLSNAVAQRRTLSLTS